MILPIAAAIRIDDAWRSLRSQQMLLEAADVDGSLLFLSQGSARS
jgi:hypothetical protein